MPIARNTPILSPEFPLLTGLDRAGSGKAPSGGNRLGQASHQSVRYRLTGPGGQTQRHTSSDLIVSTGTGTGTVAVAVANDWCASITLDRGGRALPAPTDPRLTWFAREAWPSPITGTYWTVGAPEARESLRVTVAADQLVVFGDGMEDARLTASWGQEITVKLGGRPLRLA
ncbi:hypothetical protein [Arthrobacter oryzae]|uniref:hypothetical protein n=1 Tax=Arthrobacter oryzae TaxID=409290 RepID=UPI002181EBF4|nr:hypothetical protein [Arthrobacter oryzae]